jgi:hypothetical protein
MTDTWHVEPDQLDGYLHDRVDHAVAASVEAHLLGCERCRTALAERSATADLERSWCAIERRIDATIPDRMVRAGHAMGLPEVELRVLAPTASLRLASLLAIVIALGFAALLTQRDAGGAITLSRLAFLIVAPLVPLVAVVAALGTGSEPAPELARTTPFSRLRIAALRAAVALATAVAVGVVMSTVVGGPWTRVGLWLLPALALSSVGALAAQRASASMVLAVLGSAWFIGVLTAASVTDDRLAAFRLEPQLVYLAIAAIAAALIAFRPSLVDLRESP